MLPPILKIFLKVGRTRSVGNRSQTAHNALEPVRHILVGNLGEVYDRIMYRKASIPSCESRRLLQRYVDQDGDDEDVSWVFSNFVVDLLERPDRRALLSEIVAIWLLREYVPMAKDAKAKREEA